MRCALKGVMLFFVCLMAQGILLADEEQDQDRALTQEICRMLAEGHVTRRAPDDVISRRAWTNLLERYDLDRMVFLPEDIAAFEHVADKLDNAFRKGDFAFMFHLDGIYRERLRERTVFVTNALARTTFDFDGNDTYRIRGKTSQWLPAGAERDAVWMARLKGEVLDEWLSCETGGVAKAVAAVAKSYTDALDDERKRDPAGLRSAFIADIVSAYDAHTLYLPPDLYEMFRSEMDLSLCGVGAEWRLKDGAAKIRRVIPGGPMAKDGRIHVGDWIIGVAPDNDAKIERLEGMGEEEIVALFRGEKGTKLTFEVKHADGRRGVYTLTRDEVAMEDMAASSRVVEVDIDGARRKVGYLRLASFYASELQKSARRSCFEDLRVELRKLREADVAGVLFDLRENGGGSLDDAVKVIGLFVRNGPAVRMSGLGGASTLPVPEGTVECEVPLLVLTSRSSASAGELVPATLQDLGRAVIAGDARTFGKGSAQTVCEFDDEEEGALIITDGRFYRVTGGSTQFK
ncbi:MAG: PDZ domain-containing protein, partial [Kiritimatiellae bacterium]|nr:PDZ domain-containing protein [Kiritimatiellia bacterium]